MPAARRPPPGRRERGQRSDLLARILIAIPAAIVVIVFIDVGGLAFALFMIAVGWACLQELYRLLARWRPVAIVGFASVARWCWPPATAPSAPCSRWWLPHSRSCSW
jgi:hypothetical protein